MHEFLEQFAALDDATRLSILTAVAFGVVALARRLGLQCADGWASMPAWYEDTTLGAGRVRALAVWQGALWAAGLGDGALWRMQNGVWSQWHVFDGVTVIDDLLVDAQDRLWVAATHSGGARVYRLEVAAGGDFESGPEPPDVLAKIVRAV